MWVINQDSIAVVEVQSLALDPAEVCNFGKDDAHKTLRIWGSIADHDFVMGIYGSLEEATEVLIDFASHVQYDSDKPFTMPKSKILNNKEVA